MSWLAQEVTTSVSILFFLGLAGAIGYVLPPRWDPGSILCLALMIAALWWLYDGSFHNDPWPLVVTPGGVGIVVGIIVRRMIQFFRAWRARAR